MAEIFICFVLLSTRTPNVKLVSTCYLTSMHTGPTLMDLGHTLLGLGRSLLAV